MITYLGQSIIMFTILFIFLLSFIVEVRTCIDANVFEFEWLSRIERRLTLVPSIFILCLQPGIRASTCGFYDSLESHDECLRNGFHVARTCFQYEVSTTNPAVLYRNPTVNIYVVLQMTDLHLTTFCWSFAGHRTIYLTTGNLNTGKLRFWKLTKNRKINTRFFS